MLGVVLLLWSDPEVCQYEVAKWKGRGNIEIRPFDEVMPT